MLKLPPRVAVFVLLAATAHAQSAATPKELLASLLTADNSNDLKTVVDLYAPDAILLPPGEAAVRGKDAIRQRYERMFATTRMTVEFVAEDTDSDGRLGYIRGRTVGTRRANDGRSTEDLTNKFVMVLVREAAGWRIRSLIWNANQ